MTTRRLFIAGSAALVFASSGALAATSTAKKPKRTKRPPRRPREPPNLDPVAIVNGIYQRAMKDFDGRVVTLSFAKGDRKYNFSAELVAAWEKLDARPKVSEDDIGPIDFDPVTNSQGAAVKSFKVAAEKQDEAATTLAVTVEIAEAREAPDDKVIRYEFVREDGRWKIDDMRGSAKGKPWSIKQLLSKPVRS